ncbi:hydrolytic protein [Streptomyces sp. NPDC051218]|uniref:hydrolytic protein n=1 Tax=Streptomyces sp. NPDC051218 TaxID=3365645 RepID=UPI0037A96079
MTTSAELEIPTVTVAPGDEATTSLTVRNDSDIVEAYALEVVGDCSPWTTVEPARVSLYPGTTQTVTVRVAPPRSPETRAGQVPLGIRVRPAEHPDAVTVSETTVFIEAFRELRAELVPQRRRGWRGARYRTEVRNLGNIPVDLALEGKQDGEELGFGFAPGQQRLEPGESAEARLKVKVQRLVWFGQPSPWPFEVDVAESPAASTSTVEGSGATGTRPGSSETPKASTPGPGSGAASTSPAPTQHTVVQGEFVQMPLLPRWLLAVLAILLALILAWFALVRPAVRSTAEEAADKAVKDTPAAAEKEQRGDKNGQAPGGADSPAQGPGGSTGSQPGGGSGGSAAGDVADTVPGTGRQSSATIDIQTGGGGEKVGTYRVPEGKVLGITDAVVANFQGDEGVLTITFGDHKVTTIALETFRNQDYHWVTPIRISEKSTVTASVKCAKPGTPASGAQASECHEVLNVSGVLSDLKK